MKINKKIILIFLGMFVVIVVWVTSITHNRSISATSASEKDPTQKILLLGKYMKYQSPITAVEYKITFTDNSTGLVPGPSDYDIRAAIKIDPSDVHLWTDGLDKCDFKINMWNELPLKSAIWERTSTPECYNRIGENVYVVVYRIEGIILKRISSI